MAWINSFSLKWKTDQKINFPKVLLVEFVNQPSKYTFFLLEI